MASSQLYNVPRIKEAFVKNLNRIQPENAILEIGSYDGGSLEMWIALLGERKNFLLAIDPYHNPNGYLNVNPEELYLSATRIIKTYSNQCFIRETSDLFFSQIAPEQMFLAWDGKETFNPKKLSEMKIGFALIDGFHSEDQMKRDFLNVVPYMADSSLIVFDDVAWAKGLDQWLTEKCQELNLTIEFMNSSEYQNHQALIWKGLL